MSATIYNLHRAAPERRKVAKIAQVVRDGGVLLYPSDTGYALGCGLSGKNAITRIRSIRQMDARKAMTFLCPSLASLAEFAMVEDPTYRALRRLVPGPFTFVLQASKQVPRFAQDPKRRSAGLRVPDDSICQALLAELGAPLISISAHDGQEQAGDHPELLVDRLRKRVDVAVTADSYDFVGESSVVDFTDELPRLIRAGAGLDLLQRVLDVGADA